MTSKHEWEQSPTLRFKAGNEATWLPVHKKEPASVGCKLFLAGDDSLMHTGERGIETRVIGFLIIFPRIYFLICVTTCTRITCTHSVIAFLHQRECRDDEEIIFLFIHILMFLLDKNLGGLAIIVFNYVEATGE